jgi:hypothetical protein
MFHFPRFPFASYEFTGRILRHYPQWVSPFGHLRVNGCLPPDRSLSQATTSFFGMFCRAIHQYTLNALHSLIADYSAVSNRSSAMFFSLHFFGCESSEVSPEVSFNPLLQIGIFRAIERARNGIAAE